jgi:glutamate racemase
MIGLFDSGHGGLTVLAALQQRFPRQRFLYLGDHARVPYGNRDSSEIIDFTRAGVEWLFGAGARLVILACNTATAVAARTLQRDWLPRSGWSNRNVLGIIAPTVEAATQTPWAVTTPQYPQKFNTDVVAVFATARTVATEVYPEEILKRCPRVEVFQVACAGLAGAIEAGRPEAELETMVAAYVAEARRLLAGREADRAILGCTHFPLVARHFRSHLPARTRIVSQPELVADSLEDYLSRHPQYATREPACEPLLPFVANALCVTSGDPAIVEGTLAKFMPGRFAFVSMADASTPLAKAAASI